MGRHGGGTLDYFALREDKRWFFHGDSLVAYAVFGGVCLVSPDPIGPVAEREAVWGAFWRFADSCGWVVAVMAGSEEWFPLYGAKGMHHIYIGDEAVVDVQHFSLAGGHRKGLRQARNRIAHHGYTATFCDPSRLDRPTAERLTGLMPQGRRGEFERGFSMMLGRLFDRHDEGLLMCVVTGPDGEPAAMCQLVPAPDIGGYSLDLMRRDRGDHPNGLVDFALVSTIEHLAIPATGDSASTSPGCARCSTVSAAAARSTGPSSGRSRRCPTSCRSRLWCGSTPSTDPSGSPDTWSTRAPSTCHRYCWRSFVPSHWTRCR